MAINIVIGPSFSGKYKFIEKQFPGYEIMSVGNYQRKMGDEQPERNWYEIVVEAHEQIIKDFAKAVSEGKKVVMAHTLYRAIRRESYILKLREVTEAPIDIYVMQPSDEQILKNIAEDTEREGNLKFVKEELEQIEIPTVQEGFARVYAVTANGVEDWSHRTPVKKGKPFKHICEVCGKEEILTSQEAFDEGWDYPGEEGSSMGAFGVLSPRTCGDCSITDTVWWAITTEGKTREQLTEKQLQTLERILQEPESLRVERI